MSWHDWVLTIGLVTLLSCSAVLQIRNERVFRYRSRVREVLREKSLADMYAGKDWYHWYLLFLDISYNEMLFKFWRPLDSFVPPELRPPKGVR